MLFTNPYCQNASCAPSRASVMTGLQPASTRVWSLGDKFRETIPDVVTMPRHFHKQGYYTVSMGKISHNHMPDKISFDEPDLRPAEYMTREMIDRDAESFYYDDALKAELAEVRKQRLARKRCQPTGHIKLGVKSIGKPSAVTPHAGFDVAGAGNIAWSRCCDTRRRKGELTGNAKVDLHNAPVLDPACKGRG